MKLRVYREVKARLPLKNIRFVFDEIVRREADRDWTGTVNLIITDDVCIRKLNRQFRKKDRATDVLSFNIDQPVDRDSIFGEIYISDPTVRRQARQYGVTDRDEYLRLVGHGLLHLFGYDHMKKYEAEEMRAREEFYHRLAARKKR
ncbi:MAG: rRNA maturation RNase YbeY [Candidatus Zixiibacteriota bacterium]